jgi:short-subunit dehydrogenase
MEIDGSTWVVTGASAGIGEAIAREAALRGARVIGLARRADALAAVTDSIGGVAWPADLGDPAVVDGLVARIEDEHGPTDVWVNNAGVETVGAFSDATADAVQTIHQLNLLSPIELCRQVIPRMEQRGSGHVVNVSSMASSAGFSGMSLYCSTKAGLSNFHRVMRSEMKGSPVGTTVVEIGPIPTDMLDRVYEHPPTERGFRRLRRMQLMPEIPREKVAAEVVDAVEKGRQTVRLPKRASLFPWLTSTPQRLVDLLTASRRPGGDASLRR